MSADAILGDYLPTGYKERDTKLPGMGGVFNTLNLGLFTYVHLNPLLFLDPDGNSPIRGYDPNDVRGGIRFNSNTGSWESLVYHPNNYDTNAASLVLLTAVSLVAGPEILLESTVAKMVTVSLASTRFARTIENISHKFPSSWGAGTPNRKGEGMRWQDPANPGNGVRIDKGNPNHSLPSQQVDHVVVRKDGQVIGRDGKPITGSIKSNAEQAHIPLSEYQKWKTWDSPQ